MSENESKSCNNFALSRFLRSVFKTARVPFSYCTKFIDIKILHSAEIAETAHRSPYRVSRSHRKKKESYDYNFDYDTAHQNPSPGASGEGGEDYHQTESVSSSGKSGYSEGSGEPRLPQKYRNSVNRWLVLSEGLRSIAQGSADQANSAVANQELAAKQASYIAQNNLANLALQASATAMAALQGKQVLLAKIEQENLDAHQSLEVELQQLRQSKRSAKAAQQVICEKTFNYHA